MLLSYLKVLLTEWKEGFQERAAMVIKNITNRIALHERLINLLTMKVKPVVCVCVCVWHIATCAGCICQCHSMCIISPDGKKYACYGKDVGLNQR